MSHLSRLTRTRWAAIGAAIAVALGSGAVGIVNASGSAKTGQSTYIAVPPYRVLDTRLDVGLTTVRHNEAATLRVTGLVPTTQGQVQVVPPGAAAVTVNVTAVNPTADGYISLRPGDATGEPAVSTLNVTRGTIVPNGATVTLPSTGPNAGQINIWYSGSVGATTDLLIDIVGYYTDASDLFYTKAQVDTAIAAAASGGAVDLGNYYTRQQADVAIAGAVASIPPADLSDYYTQQQTDDAIDGVADLATSTGTATIAGTILDVAVLDGGLSLGAVVDDDIGLSFYYCAATRCVDYQQVRLADTEFTDHAALTTDDAGHIVIAFANFNSDQMIESTGSIEAIVCSNMCATMTRHSLYDWGMPFGILVSASGFDLAIKASDLSLHHVRCVPLSNPQCSDDEVPGTVVSGQDIVILRTQFEPGAVVIVWQGDSGGYTTSSHVTVCGPCSTVSTWDTGDPAVATVQEFDDGDRVTLFMSDDGLESARCRIATDNVSCGPISSNRQLVSWIDGPVDVAWTENRQPIVAYSRRRVVHLLTCSDATCDESSSRAVSSDRSGDVFLDHLNGRSVVGHRVSGLPRRSVIVDIADTASLQTPPPVEPARIANAELNLSQAFETRSDLSPESVIVVNNLGHPIVVNPGDSMNTRFTILACEDPRCDSVVETVVSDLGVTGLSVTVNPFNGLPVMTYIDVTDSVWVLQCIDALCENWATLDLTDGQATAISADTPAEDDFVVAVDGGDHILSFRCNFNYLINCYGVGAFDGDGDHTFGPTSLTSTPFGAYFVWHNSDGTVVGCRFMFCSGSEVQIGTSSLSHPSVSALPDGRPVVVLKLGTDVILKVCSDADCSTRSSRVLTFSGYDDDDPEVAVMGSGFPVVLVQGASSAIRCLDSTCASTVWTNGLPYGSNTGSMALLPNGDIVALTPDYLGLSVRIVPDITSAAHRTR